MRGGRLLSFGLLGAISLGCGSDGDGAGAPAVAPPASRCPDAFVFDEALGVCAEAVPAECPAGTMAIIGEGECRPVGWSDPCPDGFVRDRTGYACVDRFEAGAACEGATREDVASGSCVPVGDCDAPFPPADATLFVDDDGPEDATHKRTISAAVDAAVAGSVIAVAAGTYVENVRLAGKTAYRIVGRCPAMVRVSSPGTPVVGLYVTGFATATVRGLTLTGFSGGVFVEGGALTLEDTVVVDNRSVGVLVTIGGTMTLRRSKVAGVKYDPAGELGAGIVVNTESSLTIEDAAVVDNDFANVAAIDPSTKVEATRTFFGRNVKVPVTAEAYSFLVDRGAEAKLARSVFLDSSHIGLGLQAKAAATVDRTVVRRTKGTLAKNGGVGIGVFGGGRATLTSSAVAENPTLGIYVDGKGSTIEARKSTIVGFPEGTRVSFGRCASASSGGRFELGETAAIDCPQAGIGLQVSASGTFDHVLVKGSWPIPENGGPYGGFGLLVEDSDATITASTFEGNTLTGLASNGANVTGSSVLVRRTRELVDRGAGSGVQLAKQGSLTLERSAIADNPSEGVVVAQASRLSLTSSTVHGTQPSEDGSFGHGIVVFEGSSADLEDVAIYEHAGVGLVSDGGSAFLHGGVIGRNAVALHVQSGSTILQSDADPGTTELDAGEVRVSSSTRFVENGTKIGTGQIPLPGLAGE